MAAPQRHEAWPATPGYRPGERRGTGKPARPSPQRKAAVHRRRFSMLVVIPVLLMLGSVYLHTVSADLGDQVAVLEEQHARAAAEKEKLDVRVSELTAPGRIRAEAQALGMKEPDSANLKVYESNGEDGTQNGGEQAQENGR